MQLPRTNLVSDKLHFLFPPVVAQEPNSELVVSSLIRSSDTYIQQHGLKLACGLIQSTKYYNSTNCPISHHSFRRLLPSGLVCAIYNYNILDPKDVGCHL